MKTFDTKFSLFCGLIEWTDLPNKILKSFFRHGDLIYPYIYQDQNSHHQFMKQKMQETSYLSKRVYIFVQKYVKNYEIPGQI